MKPKSTKKTERRICVHCYHCRVVKRGNISNHVCFHPENASLVDGLPMHTCRSLRYYGTFGCGPEGAWFKAGF
jgi:hypothetical protein